MKTGITIFFLLTLSINSYACECHEYELNELDKESYEWSDVILIGEVIKTGINYQIKVIELLKGKVENSVLNGTIYENGYHSDCTGFPEHKGEYLFYLKKFLKNGKTFYTYSQCLGTRKTDFGTVVIPLRTNKTKKELIVETEKWIDKLRERKK